MEVLGLVGGVPCCRAGQCLTERHIKPEVNLKQFTNRDIFQLRLCVERLAARNNDETQVA